MRIIDEIVNTIHLDKEYYYKILIHIKEQNQNMFGDNKNVTNKGYFKIITFKKRRIFFKIWPNLQVKKKFYPQYKIPLSVISF